MILCLYKICVCVVADAVRLCILQSIVFPKLIIIVYDHQTLASSARKHAPTW